mgnify:CR=1 FL=1
MKAALTIALPLVGSLLAVLALAWLTARMKLGPATGQRAIRDDAHAIRLAEEAECGFVGVDAAVDVSGHAAIVRDAAGAAMLIRAHGAAHAARRIDRSTTLRLDRDRLTVTPADRRFGPVTLRLGKRAPVFARDLGRIAA